MKTKITYLFLILPLLTFAQGPWEFNTSGSVEGFVAGSAGELSTAVSAASTLTQVGTDLKVDFATGQTKSPIISNPNAAINADNMNFIEIRLKNLGTATYLRVGPNTGANYVNVVISKNDTDYKTYVVDVTAWSGPAVGISLFFKLNDGGTSGANYKPTVAENMLIDYIKPLASVVSPEVNTFNFDTTTENFTVLTRAIAVQATESSRGTLKINCTIASPTNTKVALSALLAHVEGTNKYAHITLKNTSTNTLFQLNGKATVLGIAGVVTAFNPIQTYTTLDGDFKTYDFDLSTWDNGYQFPELNFAVKDTWLATSTYLKDDIVISSNSTYKNLTGNNTANAPKADIAATTLAATPANWILVGTEGVLLDLIGFVYIDSIVFDTTLSTADFGNANTTISLFPNPANDVLNISSSNSISNIEVYDMQGRKVASNHNASNVNVAALGKGAYIVKVVQENGSVIAKQFIKE
jgi:hypothetical protein